MTRDRAIEHVTACVDDAGAVRSLDDMPAEARLVGWRYGVEPVFVAVWSRGGLRLGDAEAEEIAADYLREGHWFRGDPPPADYLI